MSCECESNFEQKGRSNATWIALVAALGLTATAIVVAKRLRSSAVKGHVDDLFSACERAANKLDERVGIGYARQ
jgi:hypothetical protein